MNDGPSDDDGSLRIEQANTTSDHPRYRAPEGKKGGENKEAHSLDSLFDDQIRIDREL